jgi:hypothetical protein
MKRDTGAAPDMQRQMALTEWKTEMTAHEKNPLVVESEHFSIRQEDQHRLSHFGAGCYRTVS